MLRVIGTICALHLRSVTIWESGQTHERDDRIDDLLVVFQKLEILRSVDLSEIIEEIAPYATPEGSERGLMSDVSEFMSARKRVDTHSQRVVDHSSIRPDMISSAEELKTQIIDDDAHVIFNGCI